MPTGIINKEQILNDRNFLTYLFILLQNDLPLQGDKYLYTRFLQLFVCRLFSIAPFQITHDIPLCVFSIFQAHPINSGERKYYA